MTAVPSQLLVSAEALSLAIGDPTAQQRLQQALEDATALLSGLPARADYGDLLQQAFGSAGTAADQFSANLQALAELLQASGLQITVELRSDAEMGGALGAYAAVSPAGGERIYLNADWISSGVGVEAMVRVLLEESGHAIDQRLNDGNDSLGDEGELFALLVMGAELSDERRAWILADNDSGLLLIDGQSIAVEYDKVSTIDSVAFSSDTGASATDRITRTADQTVTVVTTNAGAGGPSVADLTPILYYSTNGGTTRTAATLTPGSWSNNGNSSTKATFTFSVTLSGTGNLTFYTDASGGSALDQTGAGSQPSTFAYTIDSAAPTVVISDDVAGLADGPVTFTFTFSEAVTGFEVSDITVANGTKGTFTAVSATVYTLVVTPTAASTGNITVDVAAGAADDAVGNASLAPAQYSQAFDTTAVVTVAISDDAAGTATGPVTFTFTFSEAVTGFTDSDITVGNGSKGTFTAVSDTVYTLVVTPTASSTGNITIDVPVNAAISTSGAIGNRAPAQYLQAFDTAAPSTPANNLTLENDSGTINDGITRNVPEFRLGEIAIAPAKYAIGDIIQIGYLDGSGNFVVAGESRQLDQNDFVQIGGQAGNLVQGNPADGYGKSLLIALSQTLQPGSYEFKVRVVDPAGNASTPSTNLITQIAPRRANRTHRLIRIYQSAHVSQCYPVPERTLSAWVPAALRHRGAM